MTGALVLRPAGTGALGAPTAPRRAPSGAISTADVSWSAPVLAWVDLPREAEDLAPERGSVAGLVVAVRGAHRAPAGGLEQRRVAVRAYADHLVLIRAARPLAPTGNGRLRPPAGPWAVAAESRRATGPATVRTGTVPAGPLATSATPVATGTAPRNPLAAAALDVEEHLPGAVRAGLDRWVPRPVVHLGELVRWSSVPPSQVATVVRVAADRAVVVVARRPDRADAPWSTTQWSWTLLPANPALAASPVSARPEIGGAR